MLPAEPLHAGAVRISHEFQPVTAVGGDFLHYFRYDRCRIPLRIGDQRQKSVAQAGATTPCGFFAAAN
jgi:serine phosphatase RsbU (regulator of sigma subunit)